MRIENLKYLIDFADTGSVSATASRNFMSAQGMGRVFRQLEKELGIVLFRRDGKAVRLTEAGEIVVEKSRYIVNEYHELTDSVSYYAGQDISDSSTFLIYSTPLFSLCILPLLEIQNPGLFTFMVNIEETDLASLEANASLISNGDCVFFATIPPSEDNNRFTEFLTNNGLCFHELFDCEVGALVPASSPIVQKGQCSVNFFAKRGKGTLGIACPNDAAVLGPLEKIIAADNIRLITNNFQLIKRQIRQGQMILLLPKIILATLTTGKGIAYIMCCDQDKPASRVHFGIVSSENWTKHQKAADIIQWTKENLAAKIESMNLRQYAKCFADTK